MADSDAKPIIFLDVDGVLHRLAVNFRDGELSDMHCFDKACMVHLARIASVSGSEIVLSSSWRQFDGSRERLARALAEHGLGFKRWTTIRDLDGSRASQILAFINEHAKSCQRWVILDDEDVTMGRESMMMHVVRQNFVQTDGQIGLTEEDADKALAILSSQGEGDLLEETNH